MRTFEETRDLTRLAFVSFQAVWAQCRRRPPWHLAWSDRSRRLPIEGRGTNQWMHTIHGGDYFKGSATLYQSRIKGKYIKNSKNIVKKQIAVAPEQWSCTALHWTQRKYWCECCWFCGPSAAGAAPPLTQAQSRTRQPAYTIGIQHAKWLTERHAWVYRRGNAIHREVFLVASSSICFCTIARNKASWHQIRNKHALHALPSEQ